MAQLSVEMIRRIQTVAEVYLQHESDRLERVAADRQAAQAPRPRARGQRAAPRERA